MKENIQIALPSGAKLDITIGPLHDCDALVQTISEEMIQIKVDPGLLMVTYLKDLFCMGLASKKLRESLKPLMARVAYNGSRITEKTFEPIEARGDYYLVLYEVARVNIAPFESGLFAKFSVPWEKLKSFLA